MSIREQYSVQWSNFQGTICEALSESQQKQEFVDMTLAAEGHLVKVHQLIISTASPYLKEIILSAPCPHPVIHLNNISYESLCCILEYIYTGEVTLPEKNVEDFFKAAKGLSIRGLHQLESTIIKETSPVITIQERVITPSGQTVKIATTNSQSKLRTDDDISNEVTLPLVARNLLLTRQSSPPIPQYDEMNIDTPSPIKRSREDDDIRPEHLSRLKSKEVQYTVSNRGCLQMILNRYIYNSIPHTKRENTTKMKWQCVDRRNNACPAAAVTQNGIITTRTGIHNHEYHDRRILTKMARNLVYSDMAELRMVLKSSCKETLNLSDEVNDGASVDNI